MSFDHLVKRTEKFTLDCIQLCKELPNNALGRQINGQLIRSCTSVSANYRAACKAYTTKSFVAKLSIVIEETDESEYWLGLILFENMVEEERVKTLKDEAHQLTSIFIQSRKTSLKKMKNEVNEDAGIYSKRENSTLSTQHSPLMDSTLHTPHSTLYTLHSTLKRIPFLNLTAQYKSIKDEIDNSIQNVINENAFIRGKYVEEFEQNFAKAIGVKHCIGVGNGTDAITIALKSLGIATGDEVITAANSFIATSEAITNAGANVVFVDCDPKTYTIDITKIEEKITSKTKAIIPVHLYGQPAEMNELMAIAKKHKLFVIEDAAQAHLAEYRGGKIGTFGDFTTFSFYPGKNLGAYGDAGAIVTNNDKLAKTAKMFANHGRVAKYDHEFEGYNSRMDGIQGAILDIKLKYLPEWTEQRRNIAKLYHELLKDVHEIILPFEPKFKKSVYHLFVIRTKKRDELKDYLKSKNIETGIHYPIALPNLSAYKYLKHSPEDFPISSQYQNEILSLPIYPELSEEEVVYICEAIKSFFKH